MIDLFLTFVKINFLTTSGPASIGLTKQLVVPTIVPEDKFNQMLALASGIPGSDAIQMAWQIGYYANGVLGALIAILGALLPCIMLVAAFSIGIKFVDQAMLSKFFSGVNPALCVMLLVTAVGLYSPLAGIGPSVIFGLAAVMMMLGIPMPVILVASGIFGILIL